MASELSQIKAFTFDIDGVMTDGGILCDLQGNLYRTFDAKDGFAVRMAVMNGYPVGVITGGRSGSIRERLRSCGVPAEDVYLGSSDKITDFDDFCSRHGLKREEVAFFGDDIPDVEVILAAGIGIAPADAVPQAKAAADYVSPCPGGKGCIREFFEKAMKAAGRWNYETAEYKKIF